MPGSCVTEIDETGARSGEGSRRRDESSASASDGSTIRWPVYEELVSRVNREGSVACLEGYTLDHASFCEGLDEIVANGTFSPEDAEYVRRVVTSGADLGLDERLMRGKVVHRNYKSAYVHKEKVTNALRDRVSAGKTVKLGAFSGNPRDLPGENATVVPMGAVPKRLEKDKVRPFSDHTRSRLNAACRDTDRVRHTLDTYNEISTELKEGYGMRVEDVDSAFPVLPLAPRVWTYMLVWWFDVDRPLEEQDGPNTLYMHVFADFGTGPLPGIWHLFWKAVKAVAVSRGVLTLPMPHYVDDNALIGPDIEEVDAVGDRLSNFLRDLGVPFKQLKSMRAALRQLALGFWWDSVERTRTLEESKLTSYVEFFRTMARRRVLTLSELQSIAGRMHRASMTLPSGSRVFVASILAMLRGLKLPWHRRRVTTAARDDLRAIADILDANAGRGYFDVSHLPWAPGVYTDAMKDSTRAGWGWCDETGAHEFGVYGSSMRHKHIDELEGDAVRRAAATRGHTWHGCRVPVYIDNSAFQLSLRKGWSRAARLTRIIKDLFYMSAPHDYVLVPVWISTEGNVGADALSRGDLVRYQEWCRVRGALGGNLP